MSFSFFQLTWLSSSSIVNLNGSINIGRLFIYLSLLFSKIFIVFNIVLFNVVVLIFVLYNSILNPILVVTNRLPVLSFIEPLAALITVSLLNLVFEVSLYSFPLTICKLNSWTIRTIPTMYTRIVIKLYLKLVFLSSLYIYCSFLVKNTFLLFAV